MTAEPWPPRPAGEAFPEVMCGTQVAQFLGYDLRGLTPPKGRRMIRILARDQGLPRLRRIGRAWLYSKQAIWGWLQGGDGEIDSGGQEESETCLSVSKV